MNISVSEDQKIISWKQDDLEVKIEFNKPIFQAVFSEIINSIIIIPDYREVGVNNFIIYSKEGFVVARPRLPKLQSKVRGVYCIWYVEGQENQTIVLSTEDKNDYDTKCTVNLLDFSFSNISLTK